MTDFEDILYNVEDRIARITLNAPEKRNALSFQMRDEFVAALKRRAEADDDVTVVLIDASGPSFCSGYDLSPRNRI